MVTSVAGHSSTEYFRCVPDRLQMCRCRCCPLTVSLNGGCQAWAKVSPRVQCQCTGLFTRVEDLGRCLVNLEQGIVRSPSACSVSMEMVTNGSIGIGEVSGSITSRTVCHWAQDPLYWEALSINPNRIGKGCFLWSPAGRGKMPPEPQIIPAVGRSSA